ncbi:unnamed protein product [Owenia fusiformis]|uniref:Uncharacterized protein n=1 Tax=Owenia fusiformis TaxID=6347 RepID=A0A8J1UB55_OWEFU|nr:unnamed protein product [Owenia fusiformis]
MDRLCQYSTIIFAGNITVLLIVAISTDYWEHRYFDFSIINETVSKQRQIKADNKTMLLQPRDTRSYFYINYSRVRLHHPTTGLENGSTYEPPAYMTKVVVDCDAPTTEAPQVVFPIRTTHATILNGTNVTAPEPQWRNETGSIYFFSQYGNLFRDCDDLEGAVRIRLGLTATRVERCFSFITGSEINDRAHQNIPALVHLERSAFAFAVMCMMCFIISFIAGAYGLIIRHNFAMIVGSFAASLSGICLTIAIALFHGKCHLLHRREFMEGNYSPIKQKIESARTYHYGWSFVLAWICVVLCFVNSWVWLQKSQDLKVDINMDYSNYRHKSRLVNRSYCNQTYDTGFNDAGQLEYEAILATN